jgi:DNA mismatch repair protein MutL
MASVREALGKFTLAPTIDFDAQGRIDIPLPTNQPVSRPQMTVDPTYNPFHTRGAIYPDRAPKNWESLYEGLSGPRDLEISTPREPEIPDVDSCALWQYAGKYIFVPTDGGLMMVNQHRAHVAVLHAQFMEQLAHTQGAMQQLLFPEVLSLPQDEMVLVSTMADDLRAIGFDIEQLSPDSYTVQAVPSQLANQSPIPVLQHIVRQVRERGADTQAEWREQIAQALAESAAIPYGQTLTETEMRDILKRLVALPAYRLTRDGKTIVSLLSDDEINKRF